MNEIPEKYKENLKFYFNPYNQQKGNFKEKLIIDYSDGGLIKEDVFTELFSSDVSGWLITYSTLSTNGEYATLKAGAAEAGSRTYTTLPINLITGNYYKLEFDI